MRLTLDLADNRHLLDELTALAAELEAGATGSLYRFGASRAYYEIVNLRLQTIGERKAGGSADVVGLPRAADGAGDAHLRHHRGAPGKFIAQTRARGQFAAQRASMSRSSSRTRICCGR
jgi:hypothetical protein